MNFLQSQFGAYADAANMQILIDASNAQFNIPWYKKYFNIGTQQLTLTYVTVLGKTRIDAAASVVGRDSATPLRSRAALAKLQGDIPAIKVMKTLNEDDYRAYLTFQALSISDTVKKAQIFDLIFGDIKSVVNSVNKRLDYMCLEGLSTGFISMNTTNNPDGITLDTLDLLMPATNFAPVSAAWLLGDGVTMNPAATPITDIRNLVTFITSIGRHVSKMLITYSKFQTFIANPETIATLKGFFNPGGNARYVGTLDTVNQYLTAMLFPTFEIINEVVMIESNGKNVMYRPFRDQNVVFVPDGNLGEIKNSIAIEELKPASLVSYSKSGNISVSKWFLNEPFGEYTKAEWNAFPSFDQVLDTFIMQTDVVGVQPTQGVIV